MASPEPICPASGLPCETACQIDRSLPFDGCPGQLVVVAFNSIKPGTAAGPNGDEQGTYDIGARVQPFIVCGINALEQAVAQGVLTAGESRLASTTISKVRQAAAGLIRANFELPDDTKGLHVIGLANPEEGHELVLIDEEAFQSIQEV